MASKVSIISNAFVLLGNSRPINDLNDTPETAAASVLFDDLLPNILTNHPWRFAMITRALNLLVAVPIIPRWANAYQLPADYLTGYQLHPNMDFRIYEDKIFINFNNAQEPLLLDYLSEVPESKFPAYFTQLMNFSMASLIAMMVTQQAELAEIWNKKADQQLVMARTTDSQALPSPIIDKNRIFASHFVTSGFGTVR